MRYTQHSFTLPAAGPRVTIRQWDYATLTKVQFVLKYGERCPEYPDPLTACEELDVIDAMFATR